MKKGIVIEQVVEKVPKVQNVFVHVGWGGGGGGGGSVLCFHIRGSCLAHGIASF